jgi:LCP family protein required for cell wall assembly
LTDTLLVVVLEEKTGHVGLISIPRDLAVAIPNRGLERINAVYALATSSGANALAALKKSAGDFLALPIGHAIVVDLSVFEQLIDALGGVTVNVTCPITDDFVDPRTPDGRRVLDVKAEPTRMDGATAGMYVRSRHGRSDFSRARRQQSILDAVHRDLLELGNLGHLPEVWATVESRVTTDYKRYELLALARRALTVRANLVHGLVISEKEVVQRLDRGRAMLFPNLDAVDLAVSKLFSNPPPDVEHRNAPCPPADIALRHKPRPLPDVDAGLEPVPNEPKADDKVARAR